MASNAGRAIATLLIGAAVGAAVGYIVATDDKKRKEDLDKIKDSLNDWTETAKKKVNDLTTELKNKAKQKTDDIEKEIYSS